MVGKDRGVLTCYSSTLDTSCRKGSAGPHCNEPGTHTNSLIGVDLSPGHITQWCHCAGSAASGYRGTATQRKVIKCGNIGGNRADSPTPTLRGRADPHQRTKTVLGRCLC